MDTEYKSRTQKKKEDKALQRLGQQLLGLQPRLLEALDLPDELLKEIKFARKIKSHGARRRQTRHIGALLRQIDTQAIKTTLERMQSRKS